jgi:hypothetical protein
MSTLTRYSVGLSNARLSAPALGLALRFGSF